MNKTRLLQNFQEKNIPYVINDNMLSIDLNCIDNFNEHQINVVNWDDALIDIYHARAKDNNISEDEMLLHLKKNYNLILK